MIRIPSSHSRGQAAMEFLTTYGWAILVVLVMISALSYFGVLDPTIFLPEKCVFSAGIACDESGAQSGATPQIMARLKNAFGYALVIDSVTVRVQGTDPACATPTCDAANDFCNLAPSGDFTWPTDSLKFLTIPCPSLSPGMKPRADVEIKYRKADGTYLKIIKGEIQVKPV